MRFLEILRRSRHGTRRARDRQVPSDPFFQDDAGIEGFGRVDARTWEGGPADEERPDCCGGRRQIDHGRDRGSPARLSMVHHDVATLDLSRAAGRSLVRPFTLFRASPLFKECADVQ